MASLYNLIFDKNFSIYTLPNDSFKKVFVGNNSVIKNFIIMNGAYNGDNVRVENCIVESGETLLSGSTYIGEGEIKIVAEKRKRYEVRQ